MFIVNGKSHCCNDTFTDVRFTSLLAENILKRIQFLCYWNNQHFISYFIWNFHSNWLLILRVVQENKSGCFVFCTQCRTVSLDISRVQIEMHDEIFHFEIFKNFMKILKYFKIPFFKYFMKLLIFNIKWLKTFKKHD